MTITRRSGPAGGDTSRDALRAQFAALRRIPPARRLALMDDLTRLARSLSREGLKRRHPGLAGEQIDELFFALVLGQDLAARVLEHRRNRLGRPSP